MSKVIRFLEEMGSNTGPVAWSQDGYDAAVAALDVVAEQRDALLARDPDALRQLLGGRGTMYCSLYPAREDQPQQEDAEVPDEREHGDEPAPDAPAAATH